LPVHIGTLGRLVKLPYVVSQSVTPEERYSFQTTLEGRRKAQARPVGRRTWALSTNHFRPEEHSLLSQFTSGAWGAGPFYFVPTDAPHTNLLSAAGSLCLPGSAYQVSTGGSVLEGGPVDLGVDGWAARSWVNAGSTDFFLGYGEFIPVVPGQQVTGSAYVLGSGASVRLRWYDSNGAYMSSSSLGSTGTAAGFTRVFVTDSAPVGSAACLLVVAGASKATRPAVTWTSQLQPWADGQGCAKAVVSAFSRDQVKSVIDHTYSNVSFTVTEVG